MKNILTSISLQQCVQPSLQLDADKSRKKRHSNEKLTIEAVRQYIESFGYRLLSTEYLGTKDKLEIICPNQHLYPVSYNHFQRGNRCPECAGNKTHTIEAVRQHIESFGYKLISTTYVGAHAKLDTSCPAEHLYKVSYSNFQQGKRCVECSGKKKHTIESVRQNIESFEGYRLRSTVYVDCRAKLDVICPAGHLYKVSYGKFQIGIRCAECSGKKKYTIDAVKQHIESFGYQLLSTEYVNKEDKLDIVCPNQHMYRATYDNFKGGNRCPECNNISKRRTMLNGEEWEPRSRNSIAGIAWAKAVKKRDGQICQACFYPSKEIHAHHIESFARNPELQTDLNNGVTLCVNCHYALHSQYGQTTATRSDLAEFTRLKCR